MQYLILLGALLSYAGTATAQTDIEQQAGSAREAATAPHTGAIHFPTAGIPSNPGQPSIPGQPDTIRQAAARQARIAQPTAQAGGLDIAQVTEQSGVRDAAQDTGLGATQVTTQYTGQGATQVTAQYTAQDTGQDATQVTAQYTAQDAGLGATQDTAEYTAQDTVQDGVQDTARLSGIRPFIRPPYLRPGDTVSIVAPARKLAEKADTAKVRERFASWGLHVKFGQHLFDRSQPYFAGTDAQRAADLQAMIDDPGVKAVISFQGGYGSVRLLPLVDLKRLREHPKWIVGFSDVTMFHLALGRLGIESLHATMPGKFRFGRDETPEAIVSDEALRSALLGLRSRIDVDAHPLDCPGTARGRLAGGNLAILCSAIGTPEEPDFDTPTVLFIEEVGEHMYRLDRMMQQLARSGILARCKAILVGHFTDMIGQKHFGVTDPRDIIAQYVRPLGIPVVFGLPAGHEDPNTALYMGREVTVTVGDAGASIEF